MWFNNFMQLKWAEQGDRKIRAQEQQERERKFFGRVWLGGRKREGAGSPFGGPGGTHATWGRGPHPCRAELWRGSVVGPPGQPQALPRCKIGIYVKLSDFLTTFNFEQKLGT